MKRLVVVGLAALVPVLAGCVSPDGEWSVRRALGLGEPRLKVKGYNPAHIANAERVDVLGRKIIEQNTFTGIEPLCLAIGTEEPILFHRGTDELIISEGLIQQCKTEAELAAVLCTELGQMVAEKRNARRAGVERDTIPDAGLPGGTSIAGGVADDPGRAAELAFRERERPRSTPTSSPADGKDVARELMRGAGFDPAELDRVQPLLKQSARGEALRKQMSGPAREPVWER